MQTLYLMKFEKVYEIYANIIQLNRNNIILYIIFNAM